MNYAPNPPNHDPRLVEPVTQHPEAQRLSDFARVSGRLSAALSAEEVVAAILESAAPLVGASAGVVGLVRGDLVEIVG